MKRVILTLALAISLPQMVQAQELRLTLDKALEIALDENPTLKIAELEVDRFDYVRGATRGNLLPQISVSSTFNHTVKAQQMSQAMAISPDGVNAVQVAANLNMPLIVPAVYASLRMNRMQTAEAVEKARGSKIDLIAEVKKAFYNTLLSVESLRVLEVSAKTAKQTVDDTQIKYKNGLVAEYDLLTAQVQYNNLQPSIIQMRNAIELSELMLKMYLSLPEDVEVVVEGDLVALREEVYKGVDSYSMDVEANSTLRALEIQSDMLAQQLKLNKTSMMPTLAAFVQGSYYGSEVAGLSIDPTTGGFAQGEISYFDQYPISAGLSLSIPIFAGGSNINKSREIRNQIKQMELQMFYARQAVMLEARSAVNNLFSSRERMYAEELTMQQAKKAHHIAQVRYNAGAGTILELNSAQLSFTQSELNYSQAIYDFLTAKAEYDRVIGDEN